MGLLKPVYLGYGFLEVWALCIIYNQNNTAERVTSAFSDGGLSFGLHLILVNFSAFAVIGATLALVLWCRKEDRISNHGRWAVVAAALNVAGTSLVLSGAPEAGLMGLFVAGLGNAWLWICWGDVYASLDTESVEVVAIGSVFVQVVVTLVVFALPAAAQAVAVLLMAPISCALYLLSLRDQRAGMLAPASASSERSDEAFDNAFMMRFVVGLGAPITLAYFMWGSGFAIPSLGDGVEVVAVVGLLVFVLVFLGFVRFSSGFSVAAICRVELALVVAACLCALGWAGYALSRAFVFAAILISQYFILVYCARLFRQGFGNVVYTFGVGQLLNHGFGWIGSAAATLGMATIGEAAFSPSVGCVVCAMAFVVVALVRSPLAVSGDVKPLSTDGADKAQRIGALVEAYHLSAREAEVFALLAHGRSAPYIRDELTVSLNTVSSHIKHIYGKMGIHSRQELIDLVDGSRD